MKVRANGVYVYYPVPMDRINSANLGIEVGQQVRVVNLHGCPKANTMGQCHVESLEGKFLGMVCCNSLYRLQDADAAAAAYKELYG